MGFIYSPLLLITAYIETREAHKVLRNRRQGEADDHTAEQWDHALTGELANDYEADGWAKAVEATKPNVETDAAVLEIRELKEKVEQLVKIVEGLSASRGVASSP
jgi:hypothetical protein